MSIESEREELRGLVERHQHAGSFQSLIGRHGVTSSRTTSIHISRRRNGRKDVLVAIDVIHRQGVDTPVDACQANCLKEIETKLKELGAAHGEWSNRPRNGTSSSTTP